MRLPFLAVACSNLVLLENVVLTELICAVDFVTSRQFLASVFRIHCNHFKHKILGPQKIQMHPTQPRPFTAFSGARPLAG